MARRRGNGEGTITRRKDGRWEARYTAQVANGPKRRVLYGKTRSEVAQKLTRAMADRDGGLVFDTDNQTVGEYLARWLRDSVEGSVKPITFENHERLVRVHIVPALGRVKLEVLSPAHLQAFYRNRLDAGLSPRTVRYLHALLHRSLKQALRWNLVARNVAEAVDPPKIPRKDMRVLSPEQTRIFLEAAREDRLEALYVLAIHCGLRQGELLALRWEDVDLEARTLRVARTLSRTKEGPTFTAPKTARSRRTVRSTAGAMEALKRHSERQAEEIVRMDTLYRDQGLVFASEIGTPLNRHNVNPDQVKALLEAASGSRLEALYVVAVHTGLRRGELLGLRWDDIELDAGTLTVRCSLDVDGTFKAPKNQAARRTLKLTPRALDTLKAHKVRQNEERLPTGLRWQDHDLVFPNTVGRPMNPSNLFRRDFQPLLAQAGLAGKGFTIHSLRHTFATTLTDKGVHPSTAQRMLGHSDIRMTLAIYTHATDGMQDAATDALEEAFA